MRTSHTIIGAKRFHFRVRDGIGWFTLAMFTKQFGVVDNRACKVGQFSSTLLYQAQFNCLKQVFCGTVDDLHQTVTSQLLPVSRKPVILRVLFNVHFHAHSLAYSSVMSSQHPSSRCARSRKPIGCYMVKPHGQLVSVSFTHYCASTPDLSTL